MTFPVTALWDIFVKSHGAVFEQSKGFLINEDLL